MPRVLGIDIPGRKKLEYSLDIFMVLVQHYQKIFAKKLN